MSVSRFETPSPINVTLDLYVADVHMVASDRADTVIEVKPSDPGKPADVKAAENTRVEFDEVTGALSVIMRKPRSRFVNFSKRPESVDLVVQLPSGSAVRGQASMGDYEADGLLGVVSLKTDFGAVRLEQSAELTVRTGLGQVTVDRVGGPTEVHSASGDMHIGTVDGTAEISTSSGTIRVGTVSGAARLKVSNGALYVERALSDITASTSNGEVRLGEVVRGKVSATSKNGRVEVGVRTGSAAWLELNTAAGRVYNELAAAEAPEDGDPADKVEVRASTKLGDVVVRRTTRLEEDA
ncbi:MAG TPA: DUF4097 family beta strand repeat-containing protein [Actinocrinis sp.]|jgi:DUF4097 and DUF4098 domain-containing protein YvlB